MVGTTKRVRMVCAEQPPHDHGRKRPLDVGADAGAQGRRQQSENGHGRSHQDGPQSLLRAFKNRRIDVQAVPAQLGDAADHYHAVHDCHAEEGRETHACRDVEVHAPHVEGDGPADQRERDGQKHCQYGRCEMNAAASRM